MLDKIITYCFYLLFFLTPLFWTSLNHELFEFNKMFLTYGFTVIIVGSWLLKTINDKRLTINRTPLDIPLLLFLGANILSTIFSMDTHTSIWGYYSRLNGGLLSIISYLLLYWAFVSNMNKEKVFTSLKFALGAGVIISLWGILEHFGVSPSCIILRHEFNASCWIQDVQARVFATLGQPNWMAGYLAMLIFPALYFFLTAKTTKALVTCHLSLVTLYLAFTFTYSRGPTLGLIGGFIVFTILSFWRPQADRISKMLSLRSSITIILISFLLINLLFGSALTSFKLIQKFAPPSRPSISLPSSGGTQLETGGTESGQIRFIVWQGALDIFKAYPIFGSGLETFAYSYYQFRPISHNLTSEWDFLYNKAHNEYLNYLATTGIVGFGTYLLIIGTFLVWSIKCVVIARDPAKPETKQSLSLTRSPRSLSLARDDSLLILALLASYISYLIYNFFLFSVVILALFFYLFPALAFVASESTLPFTLYPLRFLYHRPIYTKIAKGIVLLATGYLLFSIFQLWYADSLFAKGEKASDLGKNKTAYLYTLDASQLNPNEPLFRSELAYLGASTATAAKQQLEATLSGELQNQAVYDMEKVIKENPKNVSFYRTAVRTYFELTSLDNKYFDKTLEALDIAIKLAPTDPKLYYNKGLIFLQLEQQNEAKLSFEKALELKPNYLEAKEQLNEINK